MTFDQHAIRLNRSLRYNGTPLPTGIRMMNPFRESPLASRVSEAFYRKYYHDSNPRHLILGINPGRFGGGVTGIPFTDPKRLVNECGIEYDGPVTHEPSSVFVYEMIHAYGGPAAFYAKFYINSVCPLGFTAVGPKGREVNYNYYDSTGLTDTVRPFILKHIRKLLKMGLSADICFCFGTGKNEAFLQKLNEEHRFFRRLIALEHPRFIMQYKAAQKAAYVDKYLSAFQMIEDL